MCRLPRLVVGAIVVASVHAAAHAWPGGLCGNREDFETIDPPQTYQDCYCNYEDTLATCAEAGSGADSGCYAVAFAAMRECADIYNVASINNGGSTILHKQTDGQETHTFSFSRAGTGTASILLINAEGVASDTRNVSSVAVILNSSTVISGSSFIASTEELTQSVSLVSGPNTITVTTTGARGDYVTLLLTED